MNNPRNQALLVINVILLLCGKKKEGVGGQQAISQGISQSQDEHNKSLLLFPRAAGDDQQMGGLELFCKWRGVEPRLTSVQ